MIRGYYKKGNYTLKTKQDENGSQITVFQNKKLVAFFMGAEMNSLIRTAERYIQGIEA